MMEAIQRNGFRNYSLFLDEEGNLFGYVEAEESWGKCLEGMATEEANLRWQADMADFFEDISGRPDQSMMRLEHVFYSP
jgi:L-rhamnose mutarotase